MSINPVTDVKAGTEAESAEMPVRGVASAASSQSKAQSIPISDVGPKQETPDPSTGTKPPEMPVDEVQVQQDSQTNGRIVIRYLDHAGELILQVPSSQVLGLARAVEQALEQQAKSRAQNEPQVAEGENAHGH